MFRWRKEISKLDIDARQVRRLHRSLGDIQVALAGLPSQEATAYVCAFGLREGFQVAVVLYLRKSQRLACYLPGERSLGQQQLGPMIDEGLRFAESMGFMMGDTDIHRFQPGERESFWRSLPLRGAGAADGEDAEDKVVETLARKKSEKPADEAVAAGTAAQKSGPLPEGGAGNQGAAAPAAGAASGMGAGPGKVNRRPPTPQEMERRRNQLLAGLGRFLASF